MVYIFANWFIVIHQHHFVNPVDVDIHTQTIEGGVLSVLKNKFRKMRGTSDALFESYLAEFNFRRQFPNMFGEILFLDSVLLLLPSVAEYSFVSRSVVTGQSMIYL